MGGGYRYIRREKSRGGLRRAPFETNGAECGCGVKRVRAIASVNKDFGIAVPPHRREGGSNGRRTERMAADLGVSVL